MDEHSNSWKITKDKIILNVMIYLCILIQYMRLLRGIVLYKNNTIRIVFMCSNLLNIYRVNSIHYITATTHRTQLYYIHNIRLNMFISSIFRDNHGHK